MSKILYFLKESLISARRNLGTTVGGIVTLFLSLFMVGISIMFSVMIGNVTSSFEEEVNIRAYIADSAKDAQIEEFNAFLQSMQTDEGNISSITFMDKDQVLEEFKTQTASNPEIIDQLDGNPLPRTYVIELRDTQRVQETADAIIGSELFTKICDNPDDPSDSVKYGQGTVERLFLVVNLIRYACIAAIVLLVFISLVFLNNTIRLAITARRREIAIMRLVGASNGFIRGPFLMEGTLEALIAALLAIAALAAGSNALLGKLSDTLSFLSFDIAQSTVFATYGLLLAIGVVIGLFGSAMAMRRYLKV